MNQQQANYLSMAIKTLPLYPDWGRYVDDFNTNYRDPLAHLAIYAGCESSNIAIGEWWHSNKPEREYGLTWKDVSQLASLNDTAPIMERKEIATVSLTNIIARKLVVE
jgi:hypothetical protein